MEGSREFKVRMDIRLKFRFGESPWMEGEANTYLCRLMEMEGGLHLVDDR